MEAHQKIRKQLQEEVNIKKQKKKTRLAGGREARKIITTSRTQEQLEPDVDIQEQFYPLIYPETVLDTRSGTITNSGRYSALIVTVTFVY